MKYLQVDSLTELTSILENVDVGDHFIVGKVEAFSRKLVRTDKKLMTSLKRQYSDDRHSTDEESSPQLRAEQGIRSPKLARVSNLRSITEGVSAGLEPPQFLLTPPLRPQPPPSITLDPEHLSSARSTTAGPGLSPLLAARLTNSPLGNMADMHSIRTLASLIEAMNLSFPDYDFRDISPLDFQKLKKLETLQQKVNTYLGHVEDREPGFCRNLWKAIDDLLKLSEGEIYCYSPDSDNNPFMDGALWAFNYFFLNQKTLVYLHCSARSKLNESSMQQDQMVEDLGPEDESRFDPEM
eukprot:315368_1